MTLSHCSSQLQKTALSAQKFVWVSDLIYDYQTSLMESSNCQDVLPLGSVFLESLVQLSFQETNKEHRMLHSQSLNMQTMSYFATKIN